MGLKYDSEISDKCIRTSKPMYTSCICVCFVFTSLCIAIYVYTFTVIQTIDSTSNGLYIIFYICKIF